MMDADGECSTEKVQYFRCTDKEREREREVTSGKEVVAMDDHEPLPRPLANKCATDGGIN